MSSSPEAEKQPYISRNALERYIVTTVGLLGDSVTFEQVLEVVPEPVRESYEHHARPSVEIDRDDDRVYVGKFLNLRGFLKYAKEGNRNRLVLTTFGDDMFEKALVQHEEHPHVLPLLQEIVRNIEQTNIL